MVLAEKLTGNLLPEIVVRGSKGRPAGAAGRYDLPVGDGFHGKLEWLCRVLTLTWLAEAAGHDPAAASPCTCRGCPAPAAPDPPGAVRGRNGRGQA
jgi:hypothetical protein